MRNHTVLVALGAILVLASCGGGSDSTSGDSVSGPSESAPESESIEDATSESTPAQEPAAETEIPDVNGTEYLFLADLQCGIYASAGQYYISGSLPEVEGGFLTYSRDDDVAVAFRFEC